MPHWEQEKFFWELEQLKEWNYVQSKRQRKSIGSSHSHGRRVHFAPDLVQDPSVSKHQPTAVNSFVVGNIVVPTIVQFNTVFE